MKKYTLLLVLTLTACGPERYSEIVGPGETGQSGAKGETGEAGKDGKSQSINLVRFTSDLDLCTAGSGVLIQVLTAGPDYGDVVVSSQQILCDGTVGAVGPAGQDGEDGSSSPLSITSIVDPCGDAPGIYDEVFLKLANGTLLASFSDNANGNNTRFSVLVPGSYVTTDGSNCHFSVDSAGNVI